MKKRHLADTSVDKTVRVTGRVGSVTTSALKSLDALAKFLDASAKYFGRAGEIS